MKFILKCLLFISVSLVMTLVAFRCNAQLVIDSNYHGKLVFSNPSDSLIWVRVHPYPYDDTVHVLMLVSDTSLHMENRGRVKVVEYDTIRIDTASKWARFWGDSTGKYITIKTEPVADSVYRYDAVQLVGYEVRYNYETCCNGAFGEDYFIAHEHKAYLDGGKHPLRLYVWQAVQIK